MKRLATLILALVGLCPIVVGAQAGTVVLSATFTFDSSSAITVWNDVPNAYPEDMGAVSLNSAFGGGFGSSLDVPFQLGFLNNGYLADCNPLAWGQKTYTVGDGTHNGDAFTVSGSTTCPYYTGEYGTYENSDNLLVGWSAVANYTMVQHKSCYRGRCITYFTSVLQGGNGVVTETTLH
jgi:hypothetical protein